MAPLLLFENLTLTIHGRVLCRDVSFRVSPNERVGITGPSGSGKTTLLRGIGRKELPAGSTADRFDKTDDAIGYVPQEGGLCPWFDMERNVDVARPRQTEPQAWRARVAEVAASMGLQNQSRRFPHQLSGGEKQRWRLARAVAAMPPFMLVDEPLTEVPLDLRGRVLERWSAEMAAQGAALLLVSHDIDVLLYMCDRILVLQGEPASVRSEEVVDGAHPRSAGTFLTSSAANDVRSRLLVPGRSA